MKIFLFFRFCSRNFFVKIFSENYLWKLSDENAWSKNYTNRTRIFIESWLKNAFREPENRGLKQGFFSIRAYLPQFHLRNAIQKALLRFFNRHQNAQIGRNRFLIGISKKVYGKSSFFATSP
jgi:hypothetical protein